VRGCQGEHHAAAREINEMPTGIPFPASVNPYAGWHKVLAGLREHRKSLKRSLMGPARYVACLSTRISACLGSLIGSRRIRG